LKNQKLTFKITSTGRSAMMAKATVPEEKSTPARLQIPDQTTATCGSIECV